METYFLIGLIFYLLAMLANDSILDGWKTNRGQTAFAAVVFVILWFPVLVAFVYAQVKKELNTR